MNKHTKSAFLGLFVVTALAILVVLLLAIGGRGMFTKQPVYTMYFDKSVRGLNIGSPLMLRGVRIGQVRDIQFSNRKPAASAGLDREDTWPIEVVVEIDPASLDIGKNVDFDATNIIDKTTRDSMLIFKGQEMVDGWLFYMVKEHGLCASLQSMSFLTGQLYIELDFMKDFPPTSAEIAELDNHVIPTRISAFERIFLSFQRKEQTDALHQALAIAGTFISSGKAQKLLDNISATAENTRAITDDARDVVATIKTGSKFTKLSFASILAQAHSTLMNANIFLCKLNEETPGLMSSAKGTLDNLNKMIAQIGSKVDTLVLDMQSLAGKLNTAADLQNGPGAKLLKDTNEMTSQMKDAFAEMENTFKVMQKSLAPDSPEQQALQASFDEIQRAARSVRSLADTLQRNPEAILRGKK